MSSPGDGDASGRPPAPDGAPLDEDVAVGEVVEDLPTTAPLPMTWPRSSTPTST